MKMEWVQKLYDKIRSWQAPDWFVGLMRITQNVFIEAIKQAGREKFDSLKDKIIQVSGEDMSGEDKFKEVYRFAKNIRIDLADSVLRPMIDSIVLGLKKQGIIK